MSERSAQRLALAEQTAADARRRLGETLSEIQEKFSPANILSEAGKGLREKGLEYTDQLIASVSTRPVVATVAASGIGWLLSRKPALGLLVRLFLGSGATSRLSAHSIVSKPRRSRRRERAATAAASEENS